VELLAEGRMAQVFALDEDRVLKLDRPEWSGVSEFEFQVINRVAAAGLPVARAHGMMTVDGRQGVVLDRVHGDSLEVALARASEGRAQHLAVLFSRVQLSINSTRVEGLPDLVTRLRAEIGQSGLAPDRVLELTDLLAALDDGERGICHFDFHPNNVMVGARGWIVIDWLTVGSGPGLADVARSLVLRGQVVDPPLLLFMRKMREHSLRQRAGAGAGADTLDAWVRVVAGARLAEGFDGAYSQWLRNVADGAIRLPPD
jgi:aminoglycoside phosphotransferase (APT) family kinase protein